MEKEISIPKHVYLYIVNEINMRDTYRTKIEDITEEIISMQNVPVFSARVGGTSYTKGDPAQAAALKIVELEADRQKYELRLARINRARAQFSNDLLAIFDRRFWNGDRQVHDLIMEELHLMDRNKYFEMWNEVQRRTAFILCPWP